LVLNGRYSLKRIVGTGNICHSRGVRIKYLGSVG
jgi:hypothetical protein